MGTFSSLFRNLFVTFSEKVTFSLLFRNFFVAHFFRCALFRNFFVPHFFGAVHEKWHDVGYCGSQLYGACSGLLGRKPWAQPQSVAVDAVHGRGLAAKLLFSDPRLHCEPNLQTHARNIGPGTSCITACGLTIEITPALAARLPEGLRPRRVNHATPRTCTTGTYTPLKKPALASDNTKKNKPRR